VFIVLAFSLVQETFHLSASPFLAIVSILIGVITIELITGFLPKAHHDHCFPPHCDKKHSHIDARRMMWTDAFHNIGDGILIVGAYMVNVHVGIAATIGILLHEIVQEMSEFFVLKEAGYSTNKALLYNFIVSSTILIGIILTLLLSSISWMIAPLLGFAGGGFIYVLARDLLPHMSHHATKQKTWPRHIIVLICGIIAMFLINSIIPHAHEHEDTSSTQHTSETKL
jgi:zinc and cadmium transporter